MRVRKCILVTLAALLVTACSSGTASRSGEEPSPEPPVTTDLPPIGSSTAATELAGRAAASTDLRYEATYRFSSGKKSPEVDVTVTQASNGWMVEVPGGARGGKSDVTIAWSPKSGYYQCSRGDTKRCVTVAKPDEDVPKELDPVVQHVFTDWLDLMRERGTPLSVAHAETPEGAVKGSKCYSLRSNSVTVSSRVPSGLYCLRSDGIVTAAEAEFGELRLDGEPSRGPKKLDLPGKVSDASPLPTKAPPKPTPSKSKKPDDDDSPSPE